MIYVTSDLHGYPLEKFQELLRKADFSEKDCCFVLGDVIDRGPDGVELLKWMMDQNNVKFVLGNHEAMLLDCSFLFSADPEGNTDQLERKTRAFDLWVSNGGRETLNALSQCDTETVAHILQYLSEAPLYASVRVNGRDFLLVHGGLGYFAPDKNIADYSPKELLWTRPKLTDRYFEDVTTILGHTPTRFYGPEYGGKALITPTWINVDTGAACGEAPMLLRLDDMQEFYLS